MKKFLGIVIAAVVTACSDQCTSVADGTETSVECEETSTVVDTSTSTDVGSEVETGTATSN